MTPTIHRLAAALMALSLAACATIRVPASPNHSGDGEPVLAVVTWNLHGGRGDLARLVADLRVGTMLPSSGDYALLVQEAITHTRQVPRPSTAQPAPSTLEGRSRRAVPEQDTLAQATSLGLATFFGPVRQDGVRQSGNAIFSTRPLGDTRVVDLPRERQPRAAVMASIEVAGARLFLVSAHLENRIGWTRGGLFSERARGRQAEALIRALPESPGIAGGDMNTWLGPSEPAWRALLQRFPDTPPERPQPTFRDRLVLDHLFFDLPEGWTATRQVIAERYGSDHHPVVGLIYAAGSLRRSSTFELSMGQHVQQHVDAQRVAPR